MASFQWSTIASPQSANFAFPVTLTAKDANGYTATGYSGAVTLSGQVGSLTTGMVLGEPTPTTYYNNGTWSLGYSFTPSTTITVTDVLHYFGSKISIWTNSGTLVASQTFSASNPGWLDTPLTTPVQLTGGTTYRIADYTAGQNYYLWSSTSHVSPLGTIGQEYEVSGDGFPTNSYSDDWWCVDLLAQVGSYTSVPISPSTVTLTAGTWTGNVTVLQAATGMTLYANDGNGHVGTSNTFNVLALPPLTVTVPANTTEGNPPTTGTVSIPAALGTNLTVNLTSSDTSRLTVQPSVTILAGQTSASVPITTINTGLLDGPEAVVVTAAASGYETAPARSRSTAA